MTSNLYYPTLSSLNSTLYSNITSKLYYPTWRSLNSTLYSDMTSKLYYPTWRSLNSTLYSDMTSKLTVFHLKVYSVLLKDISGLVITGVNGSPSWKRINPLKNISKCTSCSTNDCNLSNTLIYLTLIHRTNDKQINWDWTIYFSIAKQKKDFDNFMESFCVKIYLKSAKILVLFLNYSPPYRSNFLGQPHPFSVHVAYAWTCTTIYISR